jgi:serine carboxypeptidase-like clade 4
LWIDQPVGSGFSYSDEILDGVLNETDMKENMYDFLQGFLQTNPKYANSEFMIIGESYGGHYGKSLSTSIPLPLSFVR